MTNVKDNSTDAHIDNINGAVQDISNIARLALTSERDVTPVEMSVMINAGLTLIGTIAASLVEIAHNVGKLAAQSDRDFAAAVRAEAENLAIAKHTEEMKRSYIGMPRKGVDTV